MISTVVRTPPCTLLRKVFQPSVPVRKDSSNEPTTPSTAASAGVA